MIPTIGDTRGIKETRRFPIKFREIAIVIGSILVGSVSARGEAPIEIGSRRELFVDDFLIEKRDRVELRLHSPIPRETVFVYDAPWEGNGCTFRTIFRDGVRIRMWYTGSSWFNEDGTKLGSNPIVYCYAESSDGIHWTRPELGYYEFNGSRQNNIIWMAPGLDNFMVFKDVNPACRPGEEYKAVTQTRTAQGANALSALKSSDGLSWSPLGNKPIVTKGAFDTLNVAFWDPLRKCYFCYVRDFQQSRRIICVATSDDFLNWTEPEPLTYKKIANKSFDDALYTNNVQPYYRAPHIFVGFPTRYVDRGWSQNFLSLPDPEHRKRRMKFEPRYGTVITDGLFMSSRDGKTFDCWREAILRPGIERTHNWVYGDCFVNCGIVETSAEDPTAPPELSLYVQENHGKTAAERTRRYTLRVDGFVSLSAPFSGGEIMTKPLTFTGDTLSVNFSTSAAGSIRIELQEPDGKPISGFALEECVDLFGDQLDRKVVWKSKSALGKLAGQPIRIRFVMNDADLYAVQFK